MLKANGTCAMTIEQGIDNVKSSRMAAHTGNPSSQDMGRSQPGRHTRRQAGLHSELFFLKQKLPKTRRQFKLVIVS